MSIYEGEFNNEKTFATIWFSIIKIVIYKKNKMENIYSCDSIDQSFAFLSCSSFTPPVNNPENYLPPTDCSQSNSMNIDMNIVYFHTDPIDGANMKSDTTGNNQEKNCYGFCFNGDCYSLLHHTNIMIFYPSPLVTGGHISETPSHLVWRHIFCNFTPRNYYINTSNCAKWTLNIITCILVKLFNVQCSLLFNGIVSIWFIHGISP